MAAPRDAEKHDMRRFGDWGDDGTVVPMEPYEMLPEAEGAELPDDGGDDPDDQ